MSKQQDKSMDWLILLPVIMISFIGTFTGIFNGNPIAGFLWGLGIGLSVLAVTFIQINGWEWLQGHMSKGKLSPYITVGILVAVVISGYFAFTLGSTSCEERDISSCVQYADGGFEASDEQRWTEFWSKLPITAIIASLIATIVHHNIHNKK